ncbi:DNA gyrase inhibitor YacG [Novimethylophilus kurashikiensis]|uniref:DNA gyrase inhibitor YacG n=1 Tax=Novimethylophilus kurashikiensis TaxID=1825523 RepID=UPI000D59A7A4|nr:DNA gyrase inhibitor YacG [Novimethylophilus kurashikiensis]
MLSAPRKKVACPTCGELIEYRTDNPYRPFCSQRCKLIDLGQWATESYRIPEKEQLPEDPHHE